MSTEKKVDVAIVGAGPGGAIAAITLARRGARVALLEAAKMPRHKVCGEFLSPEIKKVFARAGVLPQIESAGATKVDRARIVSRHHVLQTTLPGAALSLSRFRLDEILWQSAQNAGVQTRDATRVRSVTGTAREGFLLSTQCDEWRASFAINAAGRSANLTPRSTARNGGAPRYVGFKAHFRGVDLNEGAVELHPFGGGYCGLVRIEGGLTNACLLARYDVVERRSPAQFWTNLLQQCPVLAQRMKYSEIAMPWLATANISFGDTQPAHDGILHCGDAAGFIHPLTGDGMAMATRGGELAAVTIAAFLRGGLSSEDVPQVYAAAWRREFAARMKWGARLQPFLTSPQWSALALTGLQLSPKLAQRAVALTRG